MISADRILPLWLKYREALETPVRTFAFPKFGRSFEDRTYQMGVLNLSPDSTYRETVCHTFEAATVNLSPSIMYSPMGSSPR